MNIYLLNIGLGENIAMNTPDVFHNYNRARFVFMHVPTISKTTLAILVLFRSSQGLAYLTKIGYGRSRKNLARIENIASTKFLK